jgi:glycosyltransferase involved in cell wall biosynthesis
MKILQVIPFFSPKFGGSFSSAINICNGLVHKNHDITILTSDYQFDESYTYLLPNVQVISFKCPINFGLFIYTPSLKKWIFENLKDYDIIFLHNFRSYQNNIIYKIAQKEKIPYVLFAHGSVLPLMYKKKLKRIYDFFWGKKILEMATKVVASTKIEADQYKIMNVRQTKIEIIPNSIDLEKYSNLPDKGKFRSDYGIHPEEKIIFYIGRIHEIKGLSLLIKAFYKINIERKDIKLIICGPDDGYLNKLQHLVSNCGLEKYVLFIGPLYESKKISAYIDSDVFILPSIYESFGNTILEAWACGVPTIITKGCCISNMVDNAAVVIDYDINEFKNALLLVLNDEKVSSDLVGNGFKLVKEEFNFVNYVNKIELMCEILLENQNCN